MANLVCLGVNVIGLKKDNQNYGMTCAWCTMVDYNKLVMLLGSQSVTGKIIEENDIVGVSSLSTNQEDIANHFGENHSSKYDKFIDQDYYEDEGALIINHSKVMMKCRVIEKTHFKGNDEDNLIFLEVLNYTEDNSVKFLEYSNM